MDFRGIKAHVKRHYERLYRGETRCAAPVERGKALAKALGYSADLLEAVGEEDWELFVPCGNPLPFVPQRSGGRILHLGCGLGVDALAMAWKTEGRPAAMFNMDVDAGILGRGKGLASSLLPDFPGMFWICADGDHLPLRGESLEGVVMNGVFNLFPRKDSLLGEIRRVLKPGGRLTGVDLCRTVSLPDYFLREPDAWAWCMNGACREEELKELLEENGLRFARVARLEEGEWFHRVAFQGEKPPG